MATTPVPPFEEDARADRPVSYYGATKRSGELLSHSYAELFGLKQTGLRFFTVYGPWGRPDMAYWLFTDAILAGRAIPVFGEGNSAAISPISTTSLRRLCVSSSSLSLPTRAPPSHLQSRQQPSGKRARAHSCDRSGYRQKAQIEQAEGPPGDVKETYADISRAKRDFGFAPDVPLAEGIRRFVAWFRTYRPD
jgi:UDP-glucuronate 4-epimerase